MPWTSTAPERAWEPSVADERTTLDGFLDKQRTTLLWKCADLTGEQLARHAVSPSGLSLLGLVRHLAHVERAWFRIRFGRQDLNLLWDKEHNNQADFEDINPSQAAADFATFRAECELADEAARGHSLDETFELRGEMLDLRWIYIHMIEEYARHNGHADLLRERIDGVTGD